MWLMNGTTILSTAVLGNVPNTWSVAATGDFNGDGMGDILWRDTSGNVGIWLMNGTSILQTAVIGNVPTNWVIAGADTHGDIFWRNSTTGEVGMWVMNGTKIASTVDFGPAPLTMTIAGIGDFDGNGSEDILLNDNLGNVTIWLLQGTSVYKNVAMGNVGTTGRSPRLATTPMNSRAAFSGPTRPVISAPGSFRDPSPSLQRRWSTATSVPAGPSNR